MRADGTAANKAAAEDGDPSVAGECMSVATHNAETFSAGDVISLADDGGDYRAILTPPSSGSIGSPITYQKYSGDTPVVNGAEVITGWVISGTANVYKYTGTSTTVQQLFIDGTLGDRHTGETLVGEYDWLWDNTGAYYDASATTLYLYCASGDPDTEYTTIEGGQRQFCISPQQDYLVFDGITVKYCNRNGFGTNSPGSNITVKNCIMEWNWYKGLGPDGVGSYSGWITEDSTARYNGIGGIGYNEAGGANVIRRCTVYENGKHQSDEDIDAAMGFGWGIKLFENGAGQVGTTIYENLVYSNGRGDAGDNQGQGVGIWVDHLAGSAVDRTEIHHNRVYDNTGNGIFVEISSYVDVYSNLLYDNASNDNGEPSGVTVDTRTTFVSNYNRIYNNTIYGGKYGLKCNSYSQGVGMDLSYNEFKNNIVNGQSVRVLYANRGGDNNGTDGDNNVYENNCFGAESADFLQWGNLSKLYSTYDTWLAASSQTDNNVESDASFNDTGSDEYWLDSDSPCIGAGENLGAPFNSGLMPSSSWPDAVVTGDQDDY
jgi:hypothetical protein